MAWLCFRPHNLLYLPEGKTRVILESSQLLSWGGLGWEERTEV